MARSFKFRFGSRNRSLDKLLSSTDQGSAKTLADKLSYGSAGINGEFYSGIERSDSVKNTFKSWVSNCALVGGALGGTAAATITLPVTIWLEEAPLIVFMLGGAAGGAAMGALGILSGAPFVVLKKAWDQIANRSQLRENSRGDKTTALKIAIASGNEVAIAALIEKGASLDAGHFLNDLKISDETMQLLIRKKAVTPENILRNKSVTISAGARAKLREYQNQLAKESFEKKCQTTESATKIQQLQQELVRSGMIGDNATAAVNMLLGRDAAHSKREINLYLQKLPEAAQAILKTFVKTEYGKENLDASLPEYVRAKEQAQAPAPAKGTKPDQNLVHKMAFFANECCQLGEVSEAKKVLQSMKKLDLPKGSKFLETFKGVEESIALADKAKKKEPWRITKFAARQLKGIDFLMEFSGTAKKFVDQTLPKPDPELKILSLETNSDSKISEEFKSHNLDRIKGLLKLLGRDSENQGVIDTVARQMLSRALESRDVKGNYSLEDEQRRDLGIEMMKSYLESEKGKYSSSLQELHPGEISELTREFSKKYFEEKATFEEAAAMEATAKAAAANPARQPSVGVGVGVGAVVAVGDKVGVGAASGVVGVRAGTVASVVVDNGVGVGLPRDGAKSGAGVGAELKRTATPAKPISIAESIVKASQVTIEAFGINPSNPSAIKIIEQVCKIGKLYHGINNASYAESPGIYKALNRGSIVDKVFLGLGDGSDSLKKLWQDLKPGSNLKECREFCKRFETEAQSLYEKTTALPVLLDATPQDVTTATRELRSNLATTALPLPEETRPRAPSPRGAPTLPKKSIAEVFENILENTGIRKTPAAIELIDVVCQIARDYKGINNAQHTDNGRIFQVSRGGIVDKVFSELMIGQSKSLEELWNAVTPGQGLGECRDFCKKFGGEFQKKFIDSRGLEVRLANVAKSEVEEAKRILTAKFAAQAIAAGVGEATRAATGVATQAGHGAGRAGAGLGARARDEFGTRTGHHHDATLGAGASVFAGRQRTNSDLTPGRGTGEESHTKRAAERKLGGRGDTYRI